MRREDRELLGALGTLKAADLLSSDWRNLGWMSTTCR